MAGKITAQELHQTVIDKIDGATGDAQFFDTSTNGASGTVAADASALTGNVFKGTCGSVAQTIATFPLKKLKHFAYSVTLTMKVSARTDTKDTIQIKVGGTLIHTWKPTDFVTANAWAFKSAAFEHFGAADVNLTVELTNQNNSVVVSVENCRVAPMNLALLT